MKIDFHVVRQILYELHACWTNCNDNGDEANIDSIVFPFSDSLSGSMECHIFSYFNMWNMNESHLMTSWDVYSTQDSAYDDLLGRNIAIFIWIFFSLKFYWNGKLIVPEWTIKMIEWLTFSYYRTFSWNEWKY